MLLTVSDLRNPVLCSEIFVVMNLRRLLTLAVLFAFSTVFAQVEVKGNVFKKDAEGKKEPIPFANVFLIGQEGVGTNTDFDGNFTLRLKEGKYQIKVSEMSVKSQVIDIEVTQGMEPLVVEMFTENTQLKEVVVGGKMPKPKTNEDVAEDVKKSEGVVVKQTASQLQDQGANDAKSGVTRMSGISASTGSSTIFIRGLGDRYNMAYLNGLPMPSPNSELRMIDLGMFPTSIIDAVGVNKVLDASYYGDYSGGMINIESKRFFTKPTLNISLSTGVNTNTTFRDFRTYTGGKLDYLGIDNAARQIPGNVLDDALKNKSQYIPNGFYQSTEGNGDGFSNNFNTELMKALPSLSYKVEGGNFWSFVKKVNNRRKKPFSKGIGFMAVFKHGTDFNYQNGRTKIVNAQSEDRLNYEFDKYKFNTSTSGMANVHYQISEKNEISYNFLYLNTSTDETKETWGTHFDYEDNGDVYARRLTYRQSNIFLNQLTGKHAFLKNDRYKINWGFSYGVTNSQEPDRRQLVYQYDPAQRDDFSSYTMFSLDKNQNHRFFSELKEKEMAFRLNNNVALAYRTIVTENGGQVDSNQVSMLDLTYGFDYRSKSRDFGFRQFNYDLKVLANDHQGETDIYNPNTYITDANHDVGKYYVEEVQNPANWYEAGQDIYAGYLGLNYKPIQNLEIIPSVRLEYGNQSVRNRNQTQPSKTDVNIIKGLEYMPSLAFKYTLKEKNVFRLVGSRTITRPKFSEVAPFQYVADFAGITAQGNPELQNGINYNADFRYEWYPSAGDIISAGAFYKYLQSPIEKTMIATASGQLQSFSNAKSATVAGVEVEVSKNLGFFSKKDSSAWNDFSVALNLAYMFTEVKIDPTGSTINTNNNRPLEGASPFLANASLKYEKAFGGKKKDEHKITTALSYNVFGRRLYAVGSNGIGDQYEAPVHLLNFVFRAEFSNKYAVGLNVGNILNATYRVQQEDRVDSGNWLEINSYKRGVDVSLSFSYKILQKTRKSIEKKRAEAKKDL